jgi:hypothetical protein
MLKNRAPQSLSIKLIASGASFRPKLFQRTSSNLIHHVSKNSRARSCPARPMRKSINAPRPPNRAIGQSQPGKWASTFPESLAWSVARRQPISSNPRKSRGCPLSDQGTVPMKIRTLLATAAGLAVLPMMAGTPAGADRVPFVTMPFSCSTDEPKAWREILAGAGFDPVICAAFASAGTCYRHSDQSISGSAEHHRPDPDNDPLDPLHRLRPPLRGHDVRSESTQSRKGKQ